MPDMTSSVRRVRVAFNAPPENIVGLENYIKIYHIVLNVYQERLPDDGHRLQGYKVISSLKCQQTTVSICVTGHDSGVRFSKLS